jgi:hypothetical protein
MSSLAELFLTQIVNSLAEKYNFDTKEAMKFLNVKMPTKMQKVAAKKVLTAKKALAVKKALAGKKALAAKKAKKVLAAKKEKKVKNAVAKKVLKAQKLATQRYNADVKAADKWWAARTAKAAAVEKKKAKLLTQILTINGLAPVENLNLDAMKSLLKTEKKNAAKKKKMRALYLRNRAPQ